MESLTEQRDAQIKLGKVLVAERDEWRETAVERQQLCDHWARQADLEKAKNDNLLKALKKIHALRSSSEPHSRRILKAVQIANAELTAPAPEPKGKP